MRKQTLPSYATNVSLLRVYYWKNAVNLNPKIIINEFGNLTTLFTTRLPTLFQPLLHNHSDGNFYTYAMYAIDIAATLIPFPS